MARINALILDCWRLYFAPCRDIVQVGKRVMPRITEFLRTYFSLWQSLIFALLVPVALIFVARFLEAPSLICWMFLFYLNFYLCLATMIELCPGNLVWKRTVVGTFLTVTIIAAIGACVFWSGMYLADYLTQRGVIN